MRGRSRTARSGSSELYTDVLIVGAGLAGLNAAAELRECAPELCVRIADAGGAASSEIMGFSAPVAPGDSPELFAGDILRSGGGCSDPGLVRTLTRNALPELHRLEAFGICFDRKPDGGYDTIHAVGTSFPRVVHSGTTTGKQAMRLLASPVERRRVVRLLTGGGRIAGVLFEDGSVIRAKAVILAGGGFAGLWKFSTWSKHLRGDALLLALGAGAELRDLGLIQFEPTVTVCPEKLAGFPVITTVLHEGAQLLNRNGEPLLDPGEPIPAKRQLAERIDRTIRDGRGTPHGGIRYDFSNVDEKRFAARYPEYYNKFRLLAPSFRELFFEVKPGAHTTLGGIRIDECCATGVPGLFAAGEAAGGLHGCDRLGGNAGLEVFVFGRIAGKSAAEYAKSAPEPEISGDTKLPPHTPEAVYAAIADILDGCFPVIADEPHLREGVARLAGLPEYPAVQLAKRIFSDALQAL